ncbi:Sin3A-associated protein [Nesidiocoris tenuis]|uniref:Sin3A-associated protein n=1 Tax=Nesidiocoris tenuis TaxID=355587 RepID=A0ABN7A8V5_9HEMI|nr:Sin3A-associated protein [Nesidiocoris tenuis]
MSDNRDSSERPTPDQQPTQSVKLEQIRTIPGGALVRTLPPQQRFIMTPMSGSAALISSTTTIQAQVLPKVTIQGGGSNANRIGAIPMQSATSSTGTFHVPKGPAAVANISVPRSSNVATPIVRGASLQTITVAPHSMPGIASSTSASTTMQIGRPVVSHVGPWVGITTSSSNHGNIQPRQPTTAHLRPTSIHQITGNKITSQIRPLDNQRMLVHSSTTHKQVVTQQAQVQLGGGGSAGEQHGTMGAKVVAGVAGSGATVLKSYGGAVGATATARLVASSPANAANLSRITTIPSAAMAVSIHSSGTGAATAVLVPAQAASANNGGVSQGTSAKTSAAVAMVTMTSSAVQQHIGRGVGSSQQSSVHHGSGTATSIQFPGSGVQPTAAALALNTVQVSRGGGVQTKTPALVTVMLSPNVASGNNASAASSQTVGVNVAAHIKPHSVGTSSTSAPGTGGPPQTSSAGVGTLSGQTIATNQPVFIQTGGTLASQVAQKAQQLPAALIVREPVRSKDESLVSVGGGGVTIHSGTVYSLSGGSYAYDGQSYLKVQQQHQVGAGGGTSQPQPPTLLHVRQATVPTSSATPHQATLRINHPMLVLSQQQQQQQHQFASTVDSSTSTNSGSLISDGSATASIGVLAIKQTTSPRPSILRKRESDSSASPLKIMKNLTPVLTSLSVVSAASSSPTMVVSQQSQSPPLKRPESGQSVQSASSSGSTTISANSSPGESPTIAIAAKQEDDSAPSAPTPVAAAPSSSVPVSSSTGQGSAEVSPRKKPRKQQLSGNPLASEPAFSDDEMEFITEDKIKKEIKEEPADEQEKTSPKKTMSMLSAYKNNWKGRNNHFLRYTDVKPKDDKKPAFSELSNQKNINQRLNGWKLYHIVSGLEDANQDNDMYNEYDTTLCLLDNNLPKNHGVDKEHIHRLSERVKANYQRSRVTEDLKGEIEANLFTLLEHKSDVADVIHRNTVKRPLKKRERL